jgi:hypothetical protein
MVILLILFAFSIIAFFPFAFVLMDAGFPLPIALVLYWFALYWSCRLIGIIASRQHSDLARRRPPSALPAP